MKDTLRKSEMDPEEAKNFLQSLLCKNLRVTTTDSRMFWGSFKCTDAESNIVLQHTYEYRHPSPSSIAQAAATATVTTTSQTTDSSANSTESGTGTGTVKLDMTSRYLGLVVVPGQHIVKIEVEEFASQVKKKDNNKDINQPSGDISTSTETNTSAESNRLVVIQEDAV